MAQDAQTLDPAQTSKTESLRDIIACWFLNCQLSLEAYWTRFRNGQNLLSTTLPARTRALARTSLDGRVFSQEPYLRPTQNCDCNAPEVVALADEFRRRTRSDWEYAHAIFDFACNAIDHSLELWPRRGVVGTLERGFGTCHEKANVLVALARAGGIPARYCTIGVGPGHVGVMSLTHDDSGIFGVVTQAARRFLVEENDPRAKRLVASFLGRCSRHRIALKARAVAGTLRPSASDVPHYVVELQLGQAWIPADPTSSDEECAAYNLPLQRFGYQPLVLAKQMGMVITGRNEAIPLRRRHYIGWDAHVLWARGFWDHMNRFGERGRARGRMILAEAGREAWIRRRKHLYRRIPAVAALDVSLPPYPNS